MPAPEWADSLPVRGDVPAPLLRKTHVVLRVPATQPAAVWNDRDRDVLPTRQRERQLTGVRAWLERSVYSRSVVA